MSSLLLPVIEYNADYELARAVPFVQAGRLATAQVHNVWRAFRRRAICRLLLSCDVEGFHADLQRSATLYAHVLDRAGPMGFATSEAAPYFDGLASGDLEVAHTVAVRSRGGWNEELEYEDDFLYTYVLMRMSGEAPPDVVDALLERLDDVVGDDESSQRDLCRALQHRSASLFEDALSRRITEHEAFYREGWTAGYIPEEEWATEGQLFIEGLALLVLAERRGIATDTDYLFVPSLARTQDLRPHNPDVWQRA